MAKDISIMDMLSSASKAAVVEEIVEKINVADIQPNQDNFYQLCDIEQLKSSIYAMGGVQQNIVVTRLPAGEKFKYKLLAGHRRTLACVELVQEGHKEFELIPAVIKNHVSSEEEEMLLIMTNSTQRELTDYEKVVQHMKLKKLIPKLKRRDNIPGKVRSLEAEFMNVSEAQIGIYNTIGTRLEADLMELFAKDEIGISLAYEIAKLSSVDQIKLIDVYLQNGRLTDEDVKYLVNNKPIAGQTKLDDIVSEKVSDSDTLEQTAAEEKVLDSDTFEEPDIDYSVEENEPEADNIEVPDIEFSVEENVSDSYTFEKGEMVYEQKAEKPRITCDEDEIDSAIKLMFCQWNSPEQILNELVEEFSKQKINPEIGAELIFSKILPYEDDYIRVSYQGGYKIELKLSRECYCIPTYYFWKGFKKVFEWKWKKVSDSDTSENSNMAAERLYTINDIELEIETYRSRCERAIKSDIALKHIMKQQMLYDALTLLLDSIKKGESR